MILNNVYRIFSWKNREITDAVDDETQGEKNQGSFGNVENHSFSSHWISELGLNGNGHWYAHDPHKPGENQICYSDAIPFSTETKTKYFGITKKVLQTISNLIFCQKILL